jgi:hypothetical protein
LSLEQLTPSKRSVLAGFLYTEAMRSSLGLRCLEYLVTFTLLACGDSGGGSASGSFPKGTTCGAAISASGAVALDVPASDSSTACTSQTSSDSGIDAGFVFVDSAFARVDLEIDDVREGQTGGGFPARLTIVHDDGRKWQGEHCTADITEHEDVGPAELDREMYRVAGSVACESAPSVPAGSGSALDVESFAFVVHVAWD